MSNNLAKFLNSQRRHKRDVAIARQVKIARANGMSHIEAHRFNKHHALDCGNTQCYICGNPRRTHKNKLTTQEQRMFQDMDSVRDKHSNGRADHEI
jgi:hypothetical protein